MIATAPQTNNNNLNLTRLAPWDSFSTKVAGKSVKEAIVAANLDWNVEVKPLQLQDGTKVNVKAFVNERTNRVLGIVGPKTYPLQNIDAFNFFDEYIEKGEATLESAGFIGSKVWLLAKINRDDCVIVQGDEVSKYILLSNSHDGKCALKVGFTPIRVLCYNTLALALKSGRGNFMSVRHSRMVKENLYRLKNIINIADSEFNKSMEAYKLLARKQINSKQLKEYVKAVFKMPEKDSEMSTRCNNILNKVLSLHEVKDVSKELLDSYMEKTGKELLENIIENYESGLGTENVKSRGTLWTAYNAVNEYLNHQKGKPEKRLYSLWFGTQGENERALNIALNMLN